MKKLNPKIVIPVAALIVLVIVFFFFTEKGLLLRKKSGKMVQFNKPNTPIGAWQANISPEFTKDVFYRDTTYTAQVKNINGNDYALLSDGSVVKWNGYGWTAHNSINF